LALSNAFVDDVTRYIFDGFIVARDQRYLGIGIGIYATACILVRNRDSEFRH
jgi:hypothetical protein